MWSLGCPIHAAWSSWLRLAEKGATSESKSSIKMSLPRASLEVLIRCHKKTPAPPAALRVSFTQSCQAPLSFSLLAATTGTVCSAFHHILHLNWLHAELQLLFTLILAATPPTSVMHRFLLHMFSSPPTHSVPKTNTSNYRKGNKGTGIEANYFQF